MGQRPNKHFYIEMKMNHSWIHMCVLYNIYRLEHEGFTLRDFHLTWRALLSPFILSSQSHLLLFADSLHFSILVYAVAWAGRGMHLKDRRYVASADDAAR